MFTFVAAECCLWLGADVVTEWPCMTMVYIPRLLFMFREEHRGPAAAESSEPFRSLFLGISVSSKSCPESFPVSAQASPRDPLSRESGAQGDSSEWPSAG